ncbi:MAG: CHAT domain-containing protein, partial [Candidatus Viridilinea halotolerans]
MPHTTLEFIIRRGNDAQLVADATLTSTASVASVRLTDAAPVVLDRIALCALALDPLAYGRQLGAQLFAAPTLRAAWLTARAYAATGTLQLRLCLPQDSAELHALRWECLCDPEDDQPFALHERMRLVRTIPSGDLTPVTLPSRPQLQALVAIANPSNLAAYGMAEVDVDGEAARIREALGSIPTVFLGDHSAAQGRATLTNVISQLRQTPTLVFLVAHGTISDGGPYLCLETEDGQVDWIEGAELTNAIARLTTRPQLIVVASCRSAGSGYDETLNALGPALASIGVPAVLGFQGDVALSTVRRLLPTLISELQRDGQLDRALAAARTALAPQGTWWQAVVWLRTDGRLWDTNTHDPRTQERLHLQALVRSHSDLIGAKLARFVGRAAEIVDIDAQIAALSPSGGYLIVQGRAGQGKSSILAAIIARDLRAQMEQPAPAPHDSQAFGNLERTVGVEWVPHHFIPYEPGREYQVNLLRDLNARLCLRYDLPRFYADSTSLPALKDYL